MPRILPVSDLHFEFHEKKFRFNFDLDSFDILISAGDEHPGVRGLEMLREECPDKTIITVPGNHNYWGRALYRHNDKMKKKAESLGIILLQNESVIIDGVKFIGSTLWTDFSIMGNQPLAMLYAKGSNGSNDYKNIKRVTNRAITPEIILEEHNKAKAFIFDEVAKPFDGKRVVITHMAPTGQSIPEYFKSDMLSACYASNLSNEICYSANPIDIWHHGHTHTSFDYDVCGTRVICNPYGYRPNDMNEKFDPTMVVEI